MDADQIIKRVIFYKQLRNQEDVARLLGIKKNDFSNRKKRGTLIPLIIEWADHEKVNLEWLLRGHEADVEAVTEFKNHPDNAEPVAQLKYILDSGNEVFKRAIQANLQAFSAAISTDARIKTLEEISIKQSQQLIELRELVKEGVKRHAYYGQDRRSGADRRQVAGVSPTGIERRSGEDRRQRPNDNGNSI